MIYSRNDDTICAPATVPGTGAVSIIRISGSNALKIIDKIVDFKNGNACNSKGYTTKFGVILKDKLDSITSSNTSSNTSTKEILDEVLVTLFRNPHSYTGEDSAEISCHASKYIVEQILLLLVKAGCRMAEPGEFTQRAFLNGKMDLAQAEAVADVIASSNAAAHRIAFNQMKGGFSKELKEMRGELLNLVSLMELELDFSEEEVEFADRSQLTSLLDRIIAHATKLIDSFRLGNAIKNGVPVAIAGPTNAGKSTLLNTLLGEERAIVSDIHGTTRDTIEEVLNIDGILFRFIDTAGIRETSETIEKIGIERSYKKIHEASIVLGMADLTALSEDKVLEILTNINFAAQKLILLFNKAEIMDEEALNKNVTTINNIVKEYIYQHVNENQHIPKVESIIISAKTGKGVEKLKEILSDYQKGLVAEADSTLVTNLRHVLALTASRTALTRALQGLHSQLPTDLVSQDIREGILSLNDIIGDISTDEILGNIFRNFCIGK